MKARRPLRTNPTVVRLILRTHATRPRRPDALAKSRNVPLRCSAPDKRKGASRDVTDAEATHQPARASKQDELPATMTARD